MNAPENSSNAAQPTENTRRKKGRARVNARQLSPILRQVIVDRFSACHDSEEIAEELRVPARTVTDVIVAALLRRQPEPTRTMTPLAMRRTA